jgi:hypothetical protein
MFGLSGENLTKRLRSKGFKTMLSQEIGWLKTSFFKTKKKLLIKRPLFKKKRFDSPDNNVGKMCTRLATEAAAVQGVELKTI